MRNPLACGARIKLPDKAPRGGADIISPDKFPFAENLRSRGERRGADARAPDRSAATNLQPFQPTARCGAKSRKATASGGRIRYLRAAP